MSLENPLWGTPRIHGELLKLGFEVAQSTVARLSLSKIRSGRNDGAIRRGSATAECYLSPGQTSLGSRLITNNWRRPRCRLRRGSSRHCGRSGPRRVGSPCGRRPTASDASARISNAFKKTDRCGRQAMAIALKSTTSLGRTEPRPALVYRAASSTAASALSETPEA